MFKRLMIVLLILCCMMQRSEAFPQWLKWNKKKAQTPPQEEVLASWNSRQKSLNQLRRWGVEGKIAIITPHDSGSASFHWHVTPSHYQFSLSGPIGSNQLQLFGKKNKVILVDDHGQHYSGKTPEALLAERWGFHLPVSHLIYWVRGLPVPDLHYEYWLDPQGRLVFLKQDGWEVHFIRYTEKNNLALPSRIDILLPKKLKAKLIIYKWQ